MQLQTQVIAEDRSEKHQMEKECKSGGLTSQARTNPERILGLHTLQLLYVFIHRVF